MKKMLMMLAVVLMTVSGASAQNNEERAKMRQMNREEMVKQRTDRTVKELGLNDEQAKQLLELNKAYAGKLPFMGRRGGGHGARFGHRPDSTRQRPARPSQEQMEARMKEMRANQKAYLEDLKKIMTDEQFGKYTEAMKKRMDRFGPNRRGGASDNAVPTPIDK